MSQHKVFKLLFLASLITLISSETLIPPLSNSTLTTTTSQVPTVNTQHETESSIDVTPSAPRADSNTESVEDVVSFGIRSFTVEVSSNEKLSASTVPNRTKQYSSTTPPSISATIELSTTASSSTQKPEPELSETEPETHKGETLNEISIDRKLDNGLYRIKIGEITTSEFNNAMLFSEREDERDEDNNLLASAPVHHEQAKVNIDDFFPSKTEDFNLIVEKAARPSDNLNENRSTILNSTSINTSNISTTNIEIELLGDSTRGEANNTADEKISDASYISRRSKKFDPSMTPQKDSAASSDSGKHDIGMTKFNFDKPFNTSRQSINGSPEFSTTKFYNSKELHGNILYKTQQPSSKLNTGKPATTSKFESKASMEKAAASLKKRMSLVPTANSRMLSRLEEKMISLDCELQSLSPDASVWRGNETHELNLPVTVSGN